MKKKLFARCRRSLLALGLLVSSMAQAQNATPDLSLDGKFDQVFDRFGNSYKLEQLMINPTPKTLSLLPVNTQTICTTSGYFDLYFESNSGFVGNTTTAIARRNVLCQLFSDISNFIVPADPSNHVKIWVSSIYNHVSNPSTSNVLGLASSFYTAPLQANVVGGIADGEIWKTIHSGEDSYTNVASPLFTQGGVNYGFFHGVVSINFENPAIQWHTDLGTATSTGLYDLYSVGLHEVIHALGFASLINYNGVSKFGTSFNYYSRYDLFLQTQNGTPLITNSGLCSLYDYNFNSSLSPNSVLSPNPATCSNIIPYPGSLNSTTCGTAVKFSGNVNQAVYTPDCFEPPSSLSHLEEPCHTPSPIADDSYYCMSNANGTGSTYMKRYPKPDERMILCDIGYKVNLNYGNNLYVDNSYIYDSDPCPGIWVGGVNDGINAAGSYSLSTTLGVPLNFTGNSILNNDFNAYSFECLEDVYGMGVLNTSNGIGATPITFTPSSAGVAVLRYVPVNSIGQKGNITYVFIYTGKTACSTTTCNLVSNGEFESTDIDCVVPIASHVDCWSMLTSSPDLFGRNCPTNDYDIPTPLGNSNPGSDTWNNGANNNNHMIGLFGLATTSGGRDEESVQTTLISPMVQNGIYTIRFKAKVGNGSSYANVPASIAVCGSPALLASMGQDYNTSSPNLTLLFPNVTIPADNAWHSISQTFTYTGSTPLNNLILGYDASQNPSINIGYVYIDAVELEPTITATITPPSPICTGYVINNLNNYANPSGGVFSGTGVSFSGGIYSFTSSTPGTYTVNYTYTNALQCVTTASATVVVSNSVAPTITVTASPTVSCAGGPVVLTATGASSYVWSPSVSCSGNCNVVTVFPTSNITYNVTGSTGSCNAVGSIAISVSTPSLCCKPANIIIPNGATSASYPTLASGLVVDIAGVFTINTNVTYTNVNFRMLPGSRINISPTNTLSLGGCHLFSCTDMWDGIYLIQSGTTAGSLIMSACTLEDATNGVVANAGSQANPMVKVINTTFNKNLNSIQYSNYTGSALAALDVTQSKFTCASSAYSFGGTLKAPYLNQRSKNGVVLSTVNNVQVGASTLSTQTNRFDNLDYGIYSLNTNAKIVNNAFTMKGGLVSSTNPIGVAIYSPNASMTLKTMTIGGAGTYEPNSFTDVFRAVDLSNMSKAYVTSNKFSCSGTPASFPVGTTNITSQYGVNLTNIKDVASVTTNSLTNFYYAIYHQRNSTTTSGCNPQITHNSNVISTGGTGYVNRGIYLGDINGSNISAAALIEIRDNKLTDIVNYGILTSYILNGAQIIGTSNYSQYVQMRYNASASSTGICVQNCKNTFVAYNAVYSTSNGNVNMAGIGLVASPNSMVKCNTMYTIGNCLAFSGDCTSPYTSANSYGAGIINNNFNNAQIGMMIGASGKVGTQGDATHATNNIWNGTPASYSLGQTMALPGTTAANSPFYCRNTVPAQWPTNHSGPGVAYVNGTTIIAASGVVPACPVIPPASFVIVPSDKDERDMTQSSTVQPSLTAEELADFNVNVYPNPNNGLFTLAADVEMKDVTIRVLNLMGEVLYEKTFKTFSRQEINLSEYSNGVYNIRINDANYTRYFKVVKQ